MSSVLRPAVFPRFGDPLLVVRGLLEPDMCQVRSRLYQQPTSCSSTLRLLVTGQLKWFGNFAAAKTWCSAPTHRFACSGYLTSGKKGSVSRGSGLRGSSQATVATYVAVGGWRSQTASGTALRVQHKSCVHPLSCQASSSEVPEVAGVEVVSFPSTVNNC